MFPQSGRGQGHVTINFSALDADSFKMAKDMKFEFARRVSMDIPDMISKNLQKRVT